MTGFPGESGSYHGAVVRGDLPCTRCGYNLKGLERGGACPECGATIRIAGESGRFDDNLTQSPLWYLRVLKIAFGLMTLAILGMGAHVWYAVSAGSAGLQSSRAVLVTIFAISTIAWSVGVYLATTKRPLTDSTVRDPILDRNVIRTAARLSPAPFLFAFVLAWTAPLAAGNGVLALAIAAGVMFLASLFGIIPLAAYLSALADWSGDTNLASRLRGATWMIAVVGSLSVVFGVITIASGPGASGLFRTPAIWGSVLVIVAVIVFLVSIVQMFFVCSWAIDNAVTGMERDARVAERRRRAADEDAARAIATAGLEDAFVRPPPPSNASEGYEGDGGIPLAGEDA